LEWYILLNYIFVANSDEDSDEEEDDSDFEDEDEDDDEYDEEEDLEEKGKVRVGRWIGKGAGRETNVIYKCYRWWSSRSNMTCTKRMPEDAMLMFPRNRIVSLSE